MIYIIFLLTINKNLESSLLNKKNYLVNNSKINKHLVDKSNNIKSVIVSGFGTSFEKAAKNAAENALKQTVGSFIDTETILKEKIILSNNSQEKIQIFQDNLREYSQGLIKYFKVLDIKNQDSLYEVIAIAEVSLTNLKTYIKKISKDDVLVPIDLYADAITYKNNKKKSVALLKSKISEINNGEVFNTEVDEIRLLKNFSFLNNNDARKKYIDKYIGLNPNETIVFTIKLSLKEKFIDNFKNILDNINHKILPSSYFDNSENNLMLSRDNALQWRGMVKRTFPNHCGYKNKNLILILDTNQYKDIYCFDFPIFDIEYFKANNKDFLENINLHGIRLKALRRGSKTKLFDFELSPYIRGRNLDSYSPFLRTSYGYLAIEYNDLPRVPIHSLFGRISRQGAMYLTDEKIIYYFMPIDLNQFKNIEEFVVETSKLS